MSLRQDFSADDLRRLARGSRDAAQARRLLALALAMIYDGASRMEAARTGAVSLQTVRDWVMAFNDAGPAGLVDRKAPGQRSKLNAVQRLALATVIEDGPDQRRELDAVAALTVRTSDATEIFAVRVEALSGFGIIA